MPPRSATAVYGLTFEGPELAMLVAIFVLLVVLVFLAIAETAVNRISRPKAEALAETNGRRGRALLTLVESPEAFMNPVLVTVNIFQTGQAFLTSFLVTRITDVWWAGILAFVVNVVVVFVFTESLPKTWAVLSAERAALAVARPTLALVRFPPLRGLSRALIGMTNVIFPGKGLKAGPFVSEREFLGLVEQAAAGEVIEHEERELIESIIEFGDTVAREVMVHRTDMVTVPGDTTVSEALDTLIREGYSRAPVVGEDIDDIIGIAYARDLFAAERADAGNMLVRDFMREARFVPETKPVRQLMRDMQAGKSHMTILVDEYGGVAGLVTLEDLIEELVGDIVDEYDREAAEVEELGEQSFRIDAALGIDELGELLGRELPDEDWDTAGGFVFGLLGHVPEPGETVDYEGWRFTVESLEGRRITTLRIEPVPVPDQSGPVAETAPAPVSESR